MSTKWQRDLALTWISTEILAMTSSKYQQKSFTTFGECYIHFLKTNLKKSFGYFVENSLIHLCMETRFENLHAFLSKRDTRRTTILSNTAISMATGCQHVTKMWFLKLPCPSDHLCQIFKKSSEKWRNMCLTAVSHVNWPRDNQANTHKFCFFGYDIYLKKGV